MAKILFNKAIKYNGIKYPAHSIVNVNKIDVKGIMKDLGGHLFIEEEPKVEEVETKEVKKK